MEVKDGNLPIYELHVQPTYSVIIPQRSGNRSERSVLQFLNEKNLQLAHETSRTNEAGEVVKRTLSKKAVRRLTNAVNWLVVSARKKWIFDKSTGKRYSFFVNFVTLTLPTTDHTISDNHFKKVMLHNFINTCRYKFDMKNFVWKVEAQENGNIHAHFTTDTFIHWRALRDVWNRILLKNGLIDTYRKKHENMSFDDYYIAYQKGSEYCYNRLKKAYDYGVSTFWSDPNTTDVHSVHKVKDIGSYLAKYMGKKEDDRREISGRLWGCSYNLSESNKLVCELVGSQSVALSDELYYNNIKWKPIESVSKKTGISRTVGDIFFYKTSDWGKVIKGDLLQLYNEHRFNIRYNVDVEQAKSIVVETVLPPDFLSLEVHSQNEQSDQVDLF